MAEIYRNAFTLYHSISKFRFGIHRMAIHNHKSIYVFIYEDVVWQVLQETDVFNETYSKNLRSADLGITPDIYLAKIVRSTLSYRGKCKTATGKRKLVRGKFFLRTVIRV
jgi:hypothetical protein